MMDFMMDFTRFRTLEMSQISGDPKKNPGPKTGSENMSSLVPMSWPFRPFPQAVAGPCTINGGFINGKIIYFYGPSIPWLC